MPIHDLPNLRILRSPLFPWEVEGQNILARVKHLNGQREEDHAFLKLEVTLQTLGNSLQWLNIDSDTSGVKITSQAYPSRGGPSPMVFIVELEVPIACNLSNNREPVSVAVTYKRKGKVLRENLAIDYRCLLGDLVEQNAAQDFAQLASKYRKDPLVQKLVQKAKPFRTYYAFEEVKRVKEWLGFGVKTQYEHEPNAAVLGLDHGAAYALSPTETVRYGGDCEDWAILFGAYLVERGYKAQMAHRPGHAWTRAHHMDLDFLSEPPYSSGYPPQDMNVAEIN